MLTFINQKDTPIELKNSVWMFNADFTTFYTERFDFVRFNQQNEIELLNEKVDVIRRAKLEVDSNGILKIKDNPYFKGFEYVDSRQINLVYETEVKDDNEYKGRQDKKYNLTRLFPTKIGLDEIELSQIMTNSEWRLEKPEEKRGAIFTFTQWQDIPASEKEKAIKDSDEYKKYKRYRNLIKVENTIVAVQQKLNFIDSKAMISKITEKEMILVNHFNDYEEYLFKRIN